MDNFKFRPLPSMDYHTAITEILGHSLLCPGDESPVPGVTAHQFLDAEIRMALVQLVNHKTDKLLNSGKLSVLVMDDETLEQLMAGSKASKFDPPPVEEGSKMLDARMLLRDLRKGK